MSYSYSTGSTFSYDSCTPNRTLKYKKERKKIPTSIKRWAEQRIQLISVLKTNRSIRKSDILRICLFVERNVLSYLSICVPVPFVHLWQKSTASFGACIFLKLWNLYFSRYELGICILILSIPISFSLCVALPKLKAKNERAYSTIIWFVTLLQVIFLRCLFFFSCSFSS